MSKFFKKDSKPQPEPHIPSPRTHAEPDLKKAIDDIRKLLMAHGLMAQFEHNEHD